MFRRYTVASRETGMPKMVTSRVFNQDFNYFTKTGVARGFYLDCDSCL